MKIRFLLDENLSQRILKSLKRRNATIDVLHVGDDTILPKGTLDPEILLYCEAEHRMLVTDNRKSMPGHEADHFAAGHHHWGILTTSRAVSIGELTFQLHLFWEASEAEEWIDRTVYLPY
ncbi:MAG TPA: DUF5615 family PIN-like protein [Ktedonobacterales bacterium]|nr:DUF5615 family PIN-like protein [Ktedonobacterales bacterium]